MGAIMAKKLTVAEVMTPSPKTISVNEKIINAKRIMSSNAIRHVPVTEGGEVVGILSDRDIKLGEALYGRKAFNEEVGVKQVCVFNPYTVEEKEDLEKVLQLMAKKRIGSALVNKNGRLSGILTTIDICRAFARHLREA